MIKAMNRLAKTFERDAGRINRRARETGSAFGAAASGVGLLSPRLARLNLIATQLVSVFSQMKTGLASIGAAAGGAAVGVGAMAASVVGIVGAITAAVAALSVLTLAMIAMKAAVEGLRKGFGVLKDAINLGAQARATAKSFAVLLGSAAAADKLIKSLKELANQTPITTQEIISAGQGLVGFGFEADKVTDTLSRLSDIASGISGLTLKELSDLFGKIFTGAFTAVDVKQLGGRGIPILGALAKSMGLVDTATESATEQVLKLVTAGKIGFKEVEAAFIAMTSAGGKFFGLNIALSKEFIGLTSTMSSKWVSFKTLLGEPLSDALRPLLTQGIEVLDGLMDAAKALQPRIRAEADRWTAIIQTALKDPAGWNEAMTTIGKIIENALTIAFLTAVDAFVTSMIRIKDAFQQLATGGGFGGPGGLEGALANIQGLIKKAAAEAVAGERAGTTIRERAVERLADPDRDIALGPLQQAAKTQLEVEAAREIGNAFDRSIGKVFDKAEREFAGLPGAATMLASGIKSLADLEASRVKIETARVSQLETERLRGLGIEPGDLAGLKAGAKTIRGQVETFSDSLGRLDKMFKAGLLSQGEFERARVKVETRFTKKAVVTEAGEAAIALQERGKQVALAGRNPAEIFRDTKKELDTLRAAGALTFDEFNRAVGIAKTTHAGAMEAIAEKQRQMVEANKSGLEKLMDQWRNTALQIDRANVDIANSIASNITTGLVSIVDRSKTAGEAFADMASGIVNEITRIVIQMLVLRALGGLGGAFGGFFGAGVRHDGSSSGESRTRMVSPAVFAGARRFHQGGVVSGLRQNEEPAILQSGETVLSREDSIKMRTKLATDQSGEAQERGGRTTEITIVNVDDVNRIREMFATNPDLILNPINKQLPRIKRMILS